MIRDMDASYSMSCSTGYSTRYGLRVMRTGMGYDTVTVRVTVRVMVQDIVWVYAM